MTSKEAFTKIMKIYGDTNSLEGTYDLFLKIEQDLKRLETLEKEKEYLKTTNEALTEMLLQASDEAIKSETENEKLKRKITSIEDFCNLIIESLKEKISMCFEEIDYPLGLADKLNGKLEAYKEISYRLKEVLDNDN